MHLSTDTTNFIIHDTTGVNNNITTTNTTDPSTTVHEDNKLVTMMDTIHIDKISQIQSKNDNFINPPSIRKTSVTTTNNNTTTLIDNYEIFPSPSSLVVKNEAISSVPAIEQSTESTESYNKNTGGNPPLPYFSNSSITKNVSSSYNRPKMNRRPYAGGNRRTTTNTIKNTYHSNGTKTNATIISNELRHHNIEQEQEQEQEQQQQQQQQKQLHINSPTKVENFHGSSMGNNHVKNKCDNYTPNVNYQYNYGYPTTMVNNNTSHITNKNSISTGIDTSKYRIYILGLLYYSSIICSDGIQLIIILILSDLFSASISSARPVSIGVALCSLINNFFVVYKIISVMCNISVHQVFSKDAEYMNHNLAQFKDTSIITHNPIENTNNSSGLIHHHSKGNRMVTTPKIISDERNHDNLNNTLPTTDSTTINTSPVVMLNEGSTYNLALPISSPINVSKNEMYVTTWSLPHQRNEMETSMFTVSPTPNPTLQISNKSSVHYNTNNTLSYPSLSTLPVAPSSSEERSSHSLDRYFRIQSQLTESKMIMNTNRNSTSITPGYFTYTVDDINSVHTNTSDEQTHSTEQEIIYDMKN